MAAMSRYADQPQEATRILVVDDCLDTAAALAALLRSFGHEVSTAPNGAEAVEQAVSFHPAVVFMDLDMPVLSGYEACRRIRESGEGEDMVIAAFTALGSQSARQLCRNCGFDCLLTKPVPVEVLLELAGGAQL
jgi:CheY-like chemotaxis protein